MHLDPSDPNLQRKIASLHPTLGYCLFIDIVGSTSLKDSHQSQWLSRIVDTFSLARAYISNFDEPLKIIGDALMFYLPMAKVTSPLTLFLGLCYLVQEKEQRLFERTKVAIGYCTDAYEVSIGMPGRDFYGKDIDLTARLLSIATEGEILMNEPFAQSVTAEYQRAPVKADFPDVPYIAGPWPQRFKGFSTYVNTYKLPAGGKSFDHAARHGLVLPTESHLST